MAEGFSITGISYIVDKNGNLTNLERILKVDGYKLELSFFADDTDSERPFRIDATYYSASGGREGDLEIERFFTEDETPYFDIERLRVTTQKQELGTKIFTKVLELSETMGIEQLSVSAREIGAYYWALLGFVPTQKEWPELYKTICARAESLGIEVDIPTRQDLPKFAKENPSALLLNTEWFGIMDLTDCEQMRHCQEYINGKLGCGLH